MNLELETAARQDAGIILSEIADSSIAINVNHAYSVGRDQLAKKGRHIGTR